MPMERQPGGGLSGGGGNPFLGSTTPRLLATQLAAVAAAANGNPSVGGVARGPTLAQIVAVHHQPGHPAMYILHPSGQALSSNPFYSSAVSSGHGQPTVSLISSAGVEGAIQAAATALQLQASPAMTAYSTSNAANAFLPRWKSSMTSMQQSAEQSQQQVRALKQMLKNSSNNKISNSALKSGIREASQDTLASKKSGEQNEILLKKLSARPENAGQDAAVSKKRKSEKIGKPISLGTTANSVDQKQGMHHKSTSNSLPHTKNKKQASTVRRSSLASDDQGKAEKKPTSSTGPSHGNNSVFSEEVICLNSDEDKSEVTTEHRTATSAKQSTDSGDLSASASMLLHYPINKKQALKLQAERYRQKVALQLAKSQTKSKKKDKSPSNTLKNGENEGKDQQVSFSTKSIQYSSFQSQERDIRDLNTGGIFSKPSYSDSSAGSVVVSGSNCEKESDAEGEKTVFSGFRIPDPDGDYPLAGPFVQGIISGNEEVLNTLYADDEISKNQMISRLLLALTQINEQEAKPTATLSLGEMESIAESLLVDRRVSQGEAVRVAFIEMKRRHDKMFRSYRKKLAKMLHQEEVGKKAGLKADNDSEEKVRSSNGQGYQGALDAMKVKYEAMIENLTRINSEKVKELEKELQLKDVERQQMLEAFKHVSAQAFGLWRKNHLS